MKWIEDLNGLQKLNGSKIWGAKIKMDRIIELAAKVGTDRRFGPQKFDGSKIHKKERQVKFGIMNAGIKLYAGGKPSTMFQSKKFINFKSICERIKRRR